MPHPRVLAKTLVDGLEIVNVNHSQAQRLGFSAHRLQFALQGLVKPLAIQGAGERVVPRLGAEPVKLLMQAAQLGLVGRHLLSHATQLIARA